MIIYNNPFETETEREEREAVLCGVGLETEVEDTDEEPLNVCHSDPWSAARDLCGCGGVPYV